MTIVSMFNATVAYGWDEPRATVEISGQVVDHHHHKFLIIRNNRDVVDAREQRHADNAIESFAATKARQIGADRIFMVDETQLSSGRGRRTTFLDMLTFGIDETIRTRRASRHEFTALTGQPS